MKDGNMIALNVEVLIKAQKDIGKCYKQSKKFKRSTVRITRYVSTISENRHVVQHEDIELKWVKGRLPNGQYQWLLKIGI